MKLGTYLWLQTCQIQTGSWDFSISSGSPTVPSRCGQEAKKRLLLAERSQYISTPYMFPPLVLWLGQSFVLFLYAVPPRSVYQLLGWDSKHFALARLPALYRVGSNGQNQPPAPSRLPQDRHFRAASHAARRLHNFIHVDIFATKVLQVIFGSVYDEALSCQLQAQVAQALCQATYYASTRLEVLLAQPLLVGLRSTTNIRYCQESRSISCGVVSVFVVIVFASFLCIILVTFKGTEIIVIPDTIDCRAHDTVLHSSRLIFVPRHNHRCAT